MYQRRLSTQCPKDVFASTHEQMVYIGKHVCKSRTGNEGMFSLRMPGISSSRIKCKAATPAIPGRFGFLFENRCMVSLLCGRHCSRARTGNPTAGICSSKWVLAHHGVATEHPPTVPLTEWRQTQSKIQSCSTSVIKFVYFHFPQKIQTGAVFGCRSREKQKRSESRCRFRI